MSEWRHIVENYTDFAVQHFDGKWRTIFYVADESTAVSFVYALNQKRKFLAGSIGEKTYALTEREMRNRVRREKNV